jgi:peptidoglycan/LPS O-acetylase OafA/YrhL
MVNDGTAELIGAVPHGQPFPFWAAGERASRLSGVDVVRLVSVVGIVWFHLKAPGSEIAYAGLPILLLLSIALPVMNSKDGPLYGEAVRRGRRLILPWVFWSAFYALLALGIALRKQQFHLPEGHTYWMLIGSNIHLWYLPFAYFATLITLALQRQLVRFRGRDTCIALTLLGGVTLLGSSMVARAWRFEAPFGQWTYSIATLPFGLAIGIALRRIRPTRAPIILGMVGLTAVATALAIALIGLGDRSTAISYGLGVPLACASFFWNPRLDTFSRVLTTLPMGIYLLHPLVFLCVYRTGLTTPGGLAMPAAVIVGSMALVLILRQTPLRRGL